MAFDAGTILAHLDLDQADFDRKMKAAQARADKFEKDPINLKINEAFSDRDVAAARKKFAQLDQQITRDATSRMKSGSGSVFGTLMSIMSGRQVTGAPTAQQVARGGALGGLSGGGGGTSGGGRSNTGGGGGGGNMGLGSGLFRGIGPGVLGLGARGATIAGLGGAALGGLPALAGVGGVAGIAGIGAGVIATGASTLIGSKNVKGKPPTQGPLYEVAQQAKAALQDTMKQAAAGMEAPLRQAFKMIPSLLKGIEPALHSLFAGAGTLIKPLLLGLDDIAKIALPLLGRAFRAVAPLVRPLLDGLGGLLKGILPGLIVLLRASGPAIKAFSGLLGTLGSGVGRMLREFAPAIKASSVILTALGKVLAGLFPIIGKLAGIMAKTLAPIFSVLAGVIRALEPTLVIIGRVFAALAGAVLKDLVAAFSALAKLLIMIRPAIQIFAKALEQAFNVLENSGVFAILGDTLEKLVPVLAKVINALARGLAPILGPIIGFVAKLSGILINGLAAAIEALLPPLTRLALTVLQALVDVLPVILPLLIGVAQIFTAGVVILIQGVADALSAIISAIPPKMLQAIVLGVLALVAAFKAMAIINIILAALSANPIILIAAACALLVIGIVELVKHWKQVWGEVKRLAADAWNFIYNGFGKYLLPLLGPVGLIALGAIELAKHWKTVTGLIKTAAHDLWQWLWSDFGAKIFGFFTKTIPGWWDAFWGFTKRRLIQPVENGLGALWKWIRDNFGVPVNRFFTQTIPGWWDSFWGATKNRLINPLKTGLGALVSWIHDHVVTPIGNFFTQTLPDKFRTAVTMIGRAWTALENVVRKPVAWVVDHVINGLISAFDWVTSHLGLGKPIKAVHPMGLAKGGRVPGYGGGDSKLALLEPGEAVVPKHHASSPSFAAWANAMGIPGYARGGRVGQNPLTGNPHLPHGTPDPGGGIGRAIGGFFHKVGDIGKIMAAVASGNTTALTNAIRDMIPGGIGGATADTAALLTAIPKILLTDVVKALIGLGGSANAGSIVKYAMSFIGRIPYVWGGTAVPGGADCSGFTQAIYAHFGIRAPRTSEAQGGWVKRGPPTPGGLAFYHSPPGGPDPGHVAIVRDGRTVISQGGGMGPQVIPLHALPLLWTGTPPGGFGTAGTSRGTMSKTAVEAVWRQAGGPGGFTSDIAQAITGAESGRRPGTIQQGQPSRTTGWGLWQITPTSGISQNGRFGNLLNSLNNAKAAVSLFRGAGGRFTPWVTYNDGAYTRWLDRGGWLEPGLTMTRNATGGREAVLTPSQSKAFMELAEATRVAAASAGPGSSSGIERRLERIIRAIENSSAVTGGAVGDALNGAARTASYRATYSARGV